MARPVPSLPVRPVLAYLIQSPSHSDGLPMTCITALTFLLVPRLTPLMKSHFLFTAMLIPIPAECQNVPPQISLHAEMFRGNPEHTGVYEASGVPQFHKIKWKFHTAGSVISSPAVDGSTVYVGSTDGNFYAVDLASGAPKWKFTTEARITSSPAVEQGVVYFSSYDGKFYAVDSATGQLKWKFQTAGEHRFTAKHMHGSLPEAETMPDPFDYYLSSPCVSGGAIYFGSGDGNVYSLNASSGKLNWKFQTGDVVHASPAVSNGT